MLNIIIQSLLFLRCQALSWKCDYTEIDGPVSTHVLYKEENENVVKWLEKYEYCRAKGDPSIYIDAGKDKCEYSRDICLFYNDECIFNEMRENDSLEECQDLLINNILSYELDSGRINTEPEQETEPCESEQELELETEPEPELEQELELELETEPELETEQEPEQEQEPETELETVPCETEPELQPELQPELENMSSAGKSNKISLLIFLLFI